MVVEKCVKWAAALALVVTTVVTATNGSMTSARAGRQVGSEGEQRDSRAHSGYSTSARNVTDVRAEWTIPEVDCSVTATSRSSIVISFDDKAGRAVESVGTSGDCRHGVPRYNTWCQTMSGPRRTMSDIQASVTVNAYIAIFSGQVSLGLSWPGHGFEVGTIDRAQSFPSATGAVRAQRKQAAGQFWPLSDFGTVYFTNVQVDEQPISDGAVLAWRMVGETGSPLAVPSGLHDDGSFAVMWRSTR